MERKRYKRYHNMQDMECDDGAIQIARQTLASRVSSQKDNSSSTSDFGRLPISPPTCSQHQTSAQPTTPEGCLTEPTTVGEAGDSGSFLTENMVPREIPQSRDQSETMVCREGSGSQHTITETISEYHVFNENVEEQSIQYSGSSDDEDDETFTNPPVDKLTCFTNKFFDMFQLPYIGLPSMNYGDILVMVLVYKMRHNLTDTALEDLLKMHSICLQNDLPDTKWLFKTLFKHNVPLTIVPFCPLCKACSDKKFTFAERNTTFKCSNSNCKKTSSMRDMKHGNFFIVLPLAPQIKAVLEHISPDILNYKFTRTKENPTNIEDIYDGELYQALSKPGGFLSNPENMSFCMNTDGVKVFNSNKMTMWPVYLTLNELPPYLRSKYMFVAGLWLSSTEPKMSMFLAPLADDLQNLAKHGLTYTCGDIMRTSRFMLLCIIADSAAKPEILNMKSHSGFDSCPKCYVHGEYISNHGKFPIDDDKNFTLRSNNQSFAEMEQAHNTKTIVSGFKGPSIALLFPHFDVIQGCTIDYMHALLIGVTKQLGMMWLHAKDNDATLQYRLTPGKLQTLNTRLVSIRPPSITKTPVVFGEQYKATDWRNFLLFYGCVCIKDVLSNEVLDNFKTLSNLSWILLKSSISQSDIENAHHLEYEFLLSVQKLYGREAMTFNMHLLSHLHECVQALGPLFCTSAFSFETANGRLNRFIQGSSGVTSQIAEKFLMHLSLQPSCLESLPDLNPRAKEFCFRLLGNLHEEPGSWSPSGRPKFITKKELGLRSLLALTNIGLHVGDRIESFLLCKRGGRGEFHTRSYSRRRLTDDSTVAIGSNVYRVEKILKIGQTIVLIGTNLKLTDLSSLPSHVKKTTETNEITAININSVSIRRAVRICIRTDSFCCFYPNHTERDSYL